MLKMQRVIVRVSFLDWVKIVFVLVGSGVRGGYVDVQINHITTG